MPSATSPSRITTLRASKVINFRASISACCFLCTICKICENGPQQNSLWRQKSAKIEQQCRRDINIKTSLTNKHKCFKNGSPALPKTTIMLKKVACFEFCIIFEKMCKISENGPRIYPKIFENGTRGRPKATRKKNIKNATAQNIKIRFWSADNPK